MAAKTQISLYQAANETVLREGGLEHFNFDTNGPGKTNGKLQILRAPVKVADKELPDGIDLQAFLEKGITYKDALSSILSTRANSALKWSWEIYSQTLGIQPQYTSLENIKPKQPILIYTTAVQESAFQKTLTTYRSDNSSYFSIINIDNSWSESSDLYFIETYIHEAGHSLGLEHPGTYNGVLNSEELLWANDSWDESIMSYVNQSESKRLFKESTAGDLLIPLTPRTLDFIALDKIYGNQITSNGPLGTRNAFNGNTTYGFNTTISNEESYIYSNLANLLQTEPVAFTIADNSGFDTIDASGYSERNIFDLRVMTGQEHRSRLSTINGKHGAISLSVNTAIEEALGGSANDIFYDNNSNNVLVGNSGDDEFFISLGNDTIDGGTGLDTIHLTGLRDDYTIAINGDETFLISNMSTSYTISASNVEHLSFNNGLEEVDLTTANFTPATQGENVDPLTGTVDQKIINRKGEDIYNSADEWSPDQAADRIVKFKREDEVDLRSIDANAIQRGQQTFRFIGSKEFTNRAGQLRFANGILSGDFNGDSEADFALAIATQGNFQFGIGNLIL